MQILNPDLNFSAIFQGMGIDLKFVSWLVFFVCTRFIAWGYRKVKSAENLLHVRSLRVKKLLENAGDYSRLKGFLQLLDEVETFHAATRIRVDLRKIIAFEHLCENGFISPNEIKGMSQYVVPGNDGCVTTVFWRSDWLFYWFLRVVAFLALGFGIFFCVMLFLANPALGATVGLIEFLIFLLVFVAIFDEVSIYNRAKTLESDLMKYELPVCQALVRPIRNAS